MDVGVVHDYIEERWPSMDIYASMVSQAPQDATGLRIKTLRPAMRQRLTPPGQLLPSMLDRLVNRLYDYPLWLWRRRRQHDLFHLADHSYSQLVHVLPHHRVVVTCHDLDTFRCLLDPGQEPRSVPFRLMTRWIMAGFLRARHYIVTTSITREALHDQFGIPARRVTVIPYGVHPIYFAQHGPLAAADGHDGPLLLHVGSSIPRKRLDILIRILAKVRVTWPRVRLLKVGGDLTAEQQALARKLGVEAAIITRSITPPEELVGLYRQADMLLLPSEREGFGIPVIEALANGLPVIASAIPTTQEIGGSAVTFCRIGDVDEWTSRVLALLEEKAACPERYRERRNRCTEHGRQFTWDNTRKQTVEVYRQMLSETPTVGRAIYQS